MAATLSLRCVGNHNHQLVRNRSKSSPRTARFHCPLSISNRVIKERPRLISAPATMVSNSSSCLSHYEKVDNKEALFAEKLDDWMSDSVLEIVKNLREAPLFVQVYDDENGTTRLETEKAIADDWPVLTRKWTAGESPSPDGVILVEELEDEDEDDDGMRAWGVVIQGKGVECGPVCYLLKTSRVGSGLGMGCTHFCLVRVQSFRESALSQLKNCWLLQ
ncbi:uncharacterized protein LOC132270718 [Cornus florida]|uniref:uncharacterized protein LOC132270718 n=1 Tax=Cornus florida TaxID=4283 RepID=UPI0028A1FD53|nr:uncharacterized protein LOC132270718 [Cornus florida]